MQKVEANLQSSKPTDQGSSAKLLIEVDQTVAQKTNSTQQKSLTSQLDMQSILDHAVGLDIFSGGVGQTQSKNPFQHDAKNDSKRPPADRGWHFAPYSDTLTDDGQIQSASDFIKLNMNKLDRNSDGEVSKNELSNALAGEKKGVQYKEDERPNSIRQLENLTKNFDALKNASRVDFSDGITMRDATTAAKELAVAIAVKNLGVDLLRGDEPLFLALDSASNGKSDGKITKMDLVNFIIDCKRLEKEHNNNDGVHLPENAAIAQKMLNDWHKFNSPTSRMVSVDTLDIITGGPGAITVESMAKAMQEKPLKEKGGYLQAQELIDRFYWLRDPRY